MEGNTWGDRFWGVDGGEGENHLGGLLMKIRLELRYSGRTADARKSPEIKSSLIEEHSPFLITAQTPEEWAELHAGKTSRSKSGNGRRLIRRPIPGRSGRSRRNTTSELMPLPARVTIDGDGLTRFVFRFCGWWRRGVVLRGEVRIRGCGTDRPAIEDELLVFRRLANEAAVPPPVGVIAWLSSQSGSSSTGGSPRGEEPT